nr:pentatricopeptide repeat-containing protein [Tanacetum cinerariifolium]
MTFDETPPPSKKSPLVDDDLDEEEAIKVTVKKNLENDIEDETLEIDEVVNIMESRNHPLKSQPNFNYNSEGHFVVNFVIQSKSFSFTLEEFGQILKIPFKGHVSYTDMWLLDYLSLSASIKGGHKDYVFAYLCHMLYCIEYSTPYNLAFFILKRMKKTRNKPKELLPYEMLLTRLFKHVVSVFSELSIDHYISYKRVMHPLAPHYERKTRLDHGKKRPRESNASSSSTTVNHPSSSR